MRDYILGQDVLFSCSDRWYSEPLWFPRSKEFRILFQLLQTRKTLKKNHTATNKDQKALNMQRSQVTKKHKLLGMKRLPGGIGVLTCPANQVFFAHSCCVIWYGSTEKRCIRFGLVRQQSPFMLRIRELGYIMTPKQLARHNTVHFSSTSISISVFFKHVILHWENNLHECCEACGHVVIATINVCVYFLRCQTIW